MKNSEILAYDGPKNLLSQLDQQRKFVLGVESVKRACPNCGTEHAKWEIHGIADVDDYDLSNSHGDEGKCKGCGRGLTYCVPFVGNPFLSLTADPALACSKEA